MTEVTALREFCDTTRITGECQRRISQLIEKEVEQAVNEARNTAREEAMREAVGVIAEAGRRAEEIVREARREAERLIAGAKNRVQAEVEEASRRRAMSEPFPNVVPPPFVDTEANRSHHGRMPIFWA